MPGDALRVGGIELVPLLDGEATLGGSLAEHFPGVPARSWDAVRRQHPALVGEGGAWRIRIRCTLIRTDRRTILVDTGVGPATAPAAGWFPAPGRLPAELDAAGVRPQDVDVVVITHVHDDHVGGTMGDPAPAFPNARYVLQAADLHAQRAWAELGEEDRVIYDATLRPLEEAGQLDVVDGDVEIAAGVGVRLAPGHTPGHQLVEVASGGERALVTADTFNLPAQIAEPAWHAGSDHEPEAANETRRAVLAELAGTGTIVVPSHFAEPFGRILVDGGGHAAWEPFAP